jgi:hypothetical protein
MSQITYEKINQPILVIFFNRPKILKLQLLSLKSFSPSYLYFAADGYLPNKILDLEKLNECKNLVSTEIDWECHLEFFYSTDNLGCDKFVPMAISWFFDKVDTGIVLEDDCIITYDFYYFSNYLLNRYKNDYQIMNISASNFHEQKWGDGDYYFSRYPANWGWATWRRAWNCYDSKMQDLDNFLTQSGMFEKIVFTTQERRFWKKFFLGLKSGKYTYWDARWLYSIWKNGGISITPNCNLSTNIGYGIDATHTKSILKTHGLQIARLEKKIIDPQSRDVQEQADYLLFKNNYKPSIKSFIRAFIFKLRNLLV